MSDREKEQGGAPQIGRRGFTKAAGLTALLAAGGVLGGGAAAYRLLLGRLSRSLCPLFDPSFASLAAERDTRQLVLDLVASGVVSPSGALDPGRVRALAATDEIVAHADFYYTTTELDLYALAFQLGSEAAVRGGRRAR